MSKIKNQFFTGIVVILPLSLTAWVVWIIFRFIGNRFLPLFKNIPEISGLPLSAQMLISATLTVLVIWFIGFWARNIIGRVILSWLERLMLKTPVVSKIYKIIRQITDTMFVDKKAFKKVAFIEYPRRGTYTLVFVTKEMKGEAGNSLVSVFMPSTPNPTTGYCIVLPERDVHVIDITINQAMEFIFSGGMIIPEGLVFPEYISREEE